MQNTTTYKLATLLAVTTMTGVASAATTYTWTGAVNDSWTNAANWDANGVPVDTNPGGNLELDGLDRIVFNASGSSNPLPGSDIPALGGNPFNNSAHSTPQLDVLFGTIAFTATGFGGQGLVKDPANTWVTNIGDGSTANGAADLTLNGGFSNGVMRDPNGVMSFVVNADGTLTLNGSGSTLVMSYGTGRDVAVALNGGSFVTPDALDMLRGSPALGGSFFDLTAAGSTVTAKFGVDFIESGGDGLDNVELAIGDGLTFRSSTAQTLGATNNNDGTFTVSIVPEPSSLALLGLGGLLIARRRR